MSETGKIKTVTYSPELLVEAALRQIAGDEQGVLAKETTAGRLREYARAALAPEQDK